jgi:predicted nucleotidyltransferase component of viral defense system
MSSRKYLSPAAFQRALEHRLRAASNTGVEFNRRRQLLVFDRFLARVVQSFGDSVILKGGLVLEFRLERARTTQDVDLRLTGTAGDLPSRLREAGLLDLGDFMRFEVTPDATHPEIQNEGMRYDGLRFRAECRIERRRYGEPFGVDVVFGEPLLGEPDRVLAADVLGFAGITPPHLHLYPIETHLAEKLHAYTLPRSRPNSRVKDLPDLAFLGMVREVDSARLRMALAQTFEFRRTHLLPVFIPEPPASWSEPYERLARLDNLPWKTLEEVTAVVRAFLDPVLAGDHERLWEPGSWSWRRRD